MEDFIDFGSGDFLFTNSYACVSANKHFKSVTSNGVCRNCGGNKIHFIPNRHKKVNGKKFVRWDDIIDDN